MAGPGLIEARCPTMTLLGTFGWSVRELFALGLLRWTFRLASLPDRGVGSVSFAFAGIEIETFLRCLLAPQLRNPPMPKLPRLKSREVA